ncbi:hypothetical protein [Spirosoma spitsbergense]|uniref:hypothetical protein n=1 Tax=Spirosoma spitsbergense TaxID=431554 RepID=UPI000376A5C5|nr:hypothetical protein [Spirosoma spitsbergense]
MKTLFSLSAQLLGILLIISLDSCKKTDDVTPLPTCRTTEYTSLDGTSNANKYSYTFTYGGDGRPFVIETKYSNFNPTLSQKTAWTYDYGTAGKVTINQTFVGQPYLTTTLTLDGQNRATHREDVSPSGSKVVYDYEYDSQGYLTKIKRQGTEETVINAENGYLRSATIGSSLYTITTNEQADLKQLIPIGFLNVQWPYVSFLGRPFRGTVTAYKIGNTSYQITINTFNGQGGLMSRDITYTDPTTNKSVSYLKETFVTSCQ